MVAAGRSDAKRNLRRRTPAASPAAIRQRWCRTSPPVMRAIASARMLVALLTSRLTRSMSARSALSIPERSCRAIRLSVGASASARCPRFAVKRSPSAIQVHDGCSGRSWYVAGSWCVRNIVGATEVCCGDSSHPELAGTARIPTGSAHGARAEPSSSLFRSSELAAPGAPVRSMTATRVISRMPASRSIAIRAAPVAAAPGARLP